MKTSREFVRFVNNMPKMTLFIFAASFLIEAIGSKILNYKMEYNGIINLFCFSLIVNIIFEWISVHRFYKIYDKIFENEKLFNDLSEEFKLTEEEKKKLIQEFKKDKK